MLRFFVFTILLSSLTWLHAQPGFENLMIERYYIADGNDSSTPNFPVPSGAETYRIYVDLSTDWRLQAIFGSTNASTGEIDSLVVRSTTPFFNNEDFGRAFGYLINTNNLDEHTTLLDSWFTTGRSGSTGAGILKPDDTNGNLPSFPNQHGLLQHDDPDAGIPIKINDGIIPGTVTATWTLVGMTLADLAVFDDINLAGTAFVEIDGALTSFASPLQGPNADNRILIGQFTTAGQFSGQLNLQIRNSITGEIQQWVAATPGAGQFTSPALTWVYNELPIVTIASPANNTRIASGDTIHAMANAIDPDGNIATVKFYYNNQLVGSDDIFPYRIAFTDPHSGLFRAEAIDNDGGSSFSSAIYIDINPYQLNSIIQYCNPEQVCIPFQAGGFGIEDMTAFDITVVFDNTHITPAGNFIKSNHILETALFNLDAETDVLQGTIDIHIAIHPDAPPGTVFSGAGELFCIVFNKLPPFAATDATEILITQITDHTSNNVITTRDTLQPALFSTIRNNIYPGSLANWKDGGPLSTVNPITIFGTGNQCDIDSSYSTIPDSVGFFHYDLTYGHHVRLHTDNPDSTIVSESINQFDAFLVRKVLLHDNNFRPSVFQIISMDVNRDGVVSAGDLSQINQRAAMHEFKQAWNYDLMGNPVKPYQPSYDWVFIDNKLLDHDPSYSISNAFPNDDGDGYSRHRVPAVPACLWTGISDSLYECPEPIYTIYYGIMLGDPTQ